MREEIIGILPYFVNFAIVVFGVVYFTRKPFEKFVYQRHEHIKDAVESAFKDREAVAARLKKVDSELGAFADTADKIWSQERHATAQESALIAERTRVELQMIESNTARIIETEANERTSKTKSVFVDLITREAEAKLKKNLRKEDHSGLVKRASGRIEVNA